MCLLMEVKCVVDDDETISDEAIMLLYIFYQNWLHQADTIVQYSSGQQRMRQEWANDIKEAISPLETVGWTKAMAT